MSQRPYIVGISGGSASGKTSFLKHLGEAMPTNNLCIVSQDNYYRPKDQQLRDENGQINFDLPTSIDRAAFHADMQRLMRGESIRIKEYTFNNAAREVQEIEMHPAPILIMEGLFIFHYAEIRDALDLKVYIDARDEIKLERRLKRDRDERGYEHDVVLYQWNNHVMPSYMQFLRPYRDEADIIVTNNSNYDRGLDVLKNHLAMVLSNK
jgi:uridine kinase